MEPSTQHFSLSVMFEQLQEAAICVVCRIGASAALHGLIAAGVVFALAITLLSRGHRYGRPLLSVFKKITIFCLIIGTPGAICLLSSGRLPAVNSLELNSIGLLGFWCLVILHLCMEEMNFQWFTQPQDADDEVDEPARMGQ